jgi:hypothetical protein
MVISAKFESRCGRCSGLINLGSKVEWSRGRAAVHVVCPRPVDSTDPNRAAVIRALAASRGESATATIAAATLTPEGARIASARRREILPRERWDEFDFEAEADEADRLLNEYDAMRRREVRGSGPDNVEAAARLEALKSVPKGIYRVSFNGTEKTYGVDYINVQLVPNEKKGTVKVGEWQGVGVGFISAGGTLNYWRQSQWSEATDPSNPRVQAVVAALDIILNTADPTEYAKAYARESQTCWRCGADLVDALSCERLMGPDCYRMQYGKGA